ncbi:MAG: hypothetical protein H0W76_09860 [Pyrinomonadaceae bacterium]|nr:hypothetical protein [Pyrinomonadaceae bacterium]
MQRLPQQHRNYDVRRERDPRAARRQILWLLCGLVLAAGFVVAARQQVAAVQYGYKCEELRRERASLLEEQQRLLLALQETNAPAHLERAAREIGLQPTRPSQIEAAPGGEQRATQDLELASTGPATVARRRR